MTASAVATGEPSDVALIEAAKQGDLYAWERIVRRHQEAVFRVAFLVVRVSDLAEVATQLTFIRAYRALLSLEEEAPLAPWLFRIAAGEAHHQRRESGRPTPSSRPGEKPEGPQMPATAIAGLAGSEQMTPAERAAISDAFERLGEQDRLAIASRYLLGLSMADAAAAMSIASDAVEEHLATALKNLRLRLADA